jgi:NADPH:quinone reductase-like Zn-dependent oxidoreductase
MKAIVCTEYGPPELLQLQEVERPVPDDDEVLVQVHASSVNFANLALVTGEPFIARLMGGGVRQPQVSIPGGDIAGRVEEVGASVTQFQPGDEVYGDISDSGFGGYAEYVAALESTLALKPVNLSFEQAAAVPQAAVVALQGLRNLGQIRPGQKVLVVGASGGIGTFGVQLAKAFGAEVTGVCSTRNLDLVRSIGADHVIDYTREDFAAGERRYDLILATAGYRSIFDYKRALAPEGTYVMTGGSMAQIFQAMLGPLVAAGSGKKMVNLSAQAKQEDLAFMTELIEAGKVAPVIDRSYSLSEVPQALAYYGQGHARGKVVIVHG